MSGRASNSGLGSLAAADCAARESVRVTARRGDRLIEEKAALAPDLIKLDVEGFEHEVLAGLRGALTARREILIVFEHEPYRLAGRGAGAPAVTLLHGLGFSVFGLARARDPRALERCDAPEAPEPGRASGARPVTIRGFRRMMVTVR